MEAEADASKAIELSPKLIDGYLTRAWARSGLGEHDRAVADTDKAFQLAPKNAQVISRRADVLFLRGDTYARKQDLAKALDDLTEAIRLVPNEPRYYAYRAAVHRMLFDENSAEAHEREVMKLRPPPPIIPGGG